MDYVDKTKSGARGFRAHLKQLSPGRKAGMVLLLLAPPVLTAIMLAWFFSMTGSIGMYRIMGTARLVIHSLGILGVALPVIAAVLLYIRWSIGGEKSLWTGALQGAAWTMVIIGILLPAMMLLAFSVVPRLSSGDKPPLLLVSGRQGKHGVPDMALCFWTVDPTVNTVAWGEGKTDRVVAEKNSSSTHAFMLRDLVGGRRYSYRINNGKVFTFKAPPTGDTLHFAVDSDAHFGASASRTDLTGKITREIARPSNGFDLFFSLGDLVQLGFLDTEWRQAIDALSPTAMRIPFRPLVGNHETLLNGIQLYERYMYPKGVDTGNGSRLWQRIDLGRVHFFLLDMEWGTETFGADQKAWLERQLKSVPALDWKIVMDHCFYYASGRVADSRQWYDDMQAIDALSPTFEKYKVDLVVTGHDHHIELLGHNGVTYAVIGAFGGEPDPPPTHISPASLWRTKVHYGLLDVLVSGGRMDLVFRDTDFKEIKKATLVKTR